MTTPPSSFLADRAVSGPRSASVAAGLSFIWPGLGQWYLGRRRAALLYALPVALVALVVLVRAASGLVRFAAQLLDPSIALTALILIIVLGAWRLLSMVDASAAVNRKGVFKGRPGQVLAVLAALVLATHGILAFYAWSFYENASQAFVGDDLEPPPGPSGTPGPTDDFGATPFATPETEDARITILLTGIDKNTQRTHSLTDTMLVLSLEPTTGEVSMVSFPRDIAEFPLYMGGTFPRKINSLYAWAAGHPDEFPDGPLPTLANELGFLLGIPIHYYAAVDLDGFERIVDEVGGVTINVERPIRDPRYDWLDGSDLGFFLDAGEQTLDGRDALAFVRSRFGAGDNDFTRAARQQQLVIALRAKLTNPAMLPRIPALLDIFGDTIRTNFPPERIDEMIGIAQAVDDTTIRRVVLQPPVYSIHPPTNTTNNTYILRLHLDAVRQLSVDLYGEDSVWWTGDFDPAGSPIPASEAPPSAAP